MWNAIKQAYTHKKYLVEIIIIYDTYMVVVGILVKQPRSNPGWLKLKHFKVFIRRTSLSTLDLDYFYFTPISDDNYLSTGLQGINVPLSKIMNNHS